MTDRFHALARGPWHPGDPSWQAQRRELLDHINWWNRMFLAAHVTDHKVPALLVELICSAPIELGPCVAKLLDSHKAQATIEAPEHGQVKVLCRKSCWVSFIAHLLENVEKHRVRESVSAWRLQVEYLPSAQETVQMVVRNSGTAPSIPARARAQGPQRQAPALRRIAHRPGSG